MVAIHSAYTDIRKPGLYSCVCVCDGIAQTHMLSATGGKPVCKPKALSCRVIRVQQQQQRNYFLHHIYTLIFRLLCNMHLRIYDYFLWFLDRYFEKWVSVVQLGFPIFSVYFLCALFVVCNFLCCGCENDRAFLYLLFVLQENLGSLCEWLFEQEIVLSIGITSES